MGGYASSGTRITPTTDLSVDDIDCDTLLVNGISAFNNSISANGTPTSVSASGLTDTNSLRVGNGGVGFYGATPQSRLVVSGSRAANAALTSLLTQLNSLGLIQDSSSA